jgi:hypothetical protein
VPDQAFIVVSLDLLSGMAEGLRASFESLVAASQPPLVHLLYQCTQVRATLTS